MPDCPFKNAKPRWARRKTARPQELLAAALDLFVERGFAATRLEDVAVRAGVSKGTLYLYFANKEELFKAVVRENVVPVIGEAESVIDSFQGPSIDLFRNIMLGWWQRIGDTKLSGISKLIMAESGNFPEVARFYQEEVMSRAERMIVRMLERGMARGEFRILDPAQTTQIVMAPLLVLMMWKHTLQACSPDTFSPHSYVQCVIDLLLNGLATRSTQPVP